MHASDAVISTGGQGLIGPGLHGDDPAGRPRMPVDDMESARRNLLMLTGALLALGLVMIYSASFVVAQQRFGRATFFLERHCVYLLSGCMALAVASLWDYHRLARLWPTLLAVSLGLLLAVLIPGIGERINGAQRWFRVGGFTFQPSEAAKPLLVLGLAGWAVTRKEAIGEFSRGFLPGAALVGLAVGLIALEPDMGTSALVLTVLSAMLFVAGVRVLHALPVMAVTVPLVAMLAWNRLGYIQTRVLNFLEGDADPLGTGYHVRQALIAQGSGGVLGLGVGQGHSKLLFLPESHNDFIFAVIGEELGLIGSMGVLLCFMLFVWQGWRVVRRAPDMLGSLIALGVTLLIGIQAAIHIAVVTRSMPAKGICLPMVSYGGSALVFTLLGVGLLLNVAAHGRNHRCAAVEGRTKLNTEY